MKVIILGFGSIGKRHAKNIEDLGHETLILDINYKLRYDADCVFICTPTQYHVSHAVEYISRGIPTFIEKPLAYSISELDKVEKVADESNTLTMVGCNLRFHPAVRNAKEMSEKHKVLFARAEFGYYLPFWRKGDYTKTYSASDYGGIIIDDIHEVDYLYWLFGKIKDVKIVCSKISELQIKREDIAEISIMFENGVSASIHCDYLMRNYHRTLDLNFLHEKVCYTIMPTNLMYKKEVKYFLDCVAKKEQPMNSVKEACYVLKKILSNYSHYTGTVDLNKAST